MKIYKVGDEFYSKSLQEGHSSHRLFPQRELWMMEHIKNIEVVTQANADAKDVDALWIDNPIYFTEDVEKLDLPVVFDAIDWYAEMAVKEGRFDVLDSLHEGSLKLSKYNKLALVSQSPLVEGYFIRNVGVRPKIRSVIPNGYDEDIHKFSPMGAGEHVLFFAGKLGRWYSNLVYFIEVVKNMKEWELVVAGDGEMLNYFMKVAGDCPRIHFLGFVDVDRVAKEITNSDVCIFPVDDCSPIVVSEYMACGRPVVNIGGRLSWLVRDSKDGFCLASPYDLKRYIKIAYDYREYMGASARDRIAPYSWSNNVRKFEDVVKELVEVCG